MKTTRSNSKIRILVTGMVIAVISLFQTLGKPRVQLQPVKVPVKKVLFVPVLLGTSISMATLQFGQFLINQ